MSAGADELAEIRAALGRGEKAPLARALTRIEQNPEASCALLDAAFAAPLGLVIGLTGPPGVGKSTLLDALIRTERAGGGAIAVLAVDPSSKASGGAVLGDRTRISVDPDDARVFVRSMAARDRLGGVSEPAYPSSVLMRALYDVTLIETVGVGQSETEIAEIVDAVVFCIQPGSGDALQFMKAGVMETPDLLLVTKGDLGAPARRAAADARAALSLAVHAEGAPDVATVSALDGASGVAPALAAMRARAALRASPERRARQAGAWSGREVALAFGREGARRLEARARPDAASATPFTDHAQRMARFRAAFDRLAL